MRKLVLLLVVALLAVPAMAAPTIELVDNGDGTVDLDYVTNSTDANDRISGIGVVVTTDGTFGAVTGFKTTGESTAADKGYGIFPGQIVISGGAITDTNTPVAESSATELTLEFGALYVDEANAPDWSGTLCTIAVSGATYVEAVTDEVRGKLVTEGLDQYDANDYLELATGWTYPACWDYPTQCNGDTDGDGDVDTTDWPNFRDSFGKSLVSNPTEYEPCADFDRDGDVDTTDWPNFRDNFGGTPAATCTPGDLNEIYKP